MNNHNGWVYHRGIMSILGYMVISTVINRTACCLEVLDQIRQMGNGPAIAAYLLEYENTEDREDYKTVTEKTAERLLEGKTKPARIKLYLDIVRVEALFHRKYDRLSDTYRRATAGLSARVEQSLDPRDLVEPLFESFATSPQPTKGVVGQKLYFLNLRSATDLLEPMILDNLENPDGREIQTLFDFRGGDLILSLARLTGAATESVRTDERNLRRINREKGRLSMAEARLKGWKPKEEVLKIISDYALDDRWWVRRWAVEVMKDSPPHYRPDLLSKLQADPHPLVREAALEVKCATSEE